MTYFIAITAALSLMGCCTVNQKTSSPTITYKEKNYNFFTDGRSPSLEEFNNTAEEAAQGNNQALTQLLAWTSLTEGEGSISYANFLLTIQETVGEKRFIHAFEDLTPEDQGTVKSLITTSRKLENFAFSEVN